MYFLAVQLHSAIAESFSPLKTWVSPKVAPLGHLAEKVGNLSKALKSAQTSLSDSYTPCGLEYCVYPRWPENNSLDSRHSILSMERIQRSLGFSYRVNNSSWHEEQCVVCGTNRLLWFDGPPWAASAFTFSVAFAFSSSSDGHAAG